MKNPNGPSIEEIDEWRDELARQNPTPARNCHCMIASMHASRDLEQGAYPCECEHCRRECDCPQNWLK